MLDLTPDLGSSGIHGFRDPWIPAFARMTSLMDYLGLSEIVGMLDLTPDLADPN